MNSTMTLEDLKDEVASRAATKQDYVRVSNRLTLTNIPVMQAANAPSGNNGYAFPTRDLGHGHIVLEDFGRRPYDDLGDIPAARALAVPTDYRLSIPGGGDVPLTEHAHNQLASYLDIPTAYYGRLRAGFPDLLGTNVNTLLGARSEQEQRFVRVERGQVRAVLSDRYRALDNDDLLRYILPVFEPLMRYQDALRFRQCVVTDSKLYLSVVSPRISSTILGDTVLAGVTLENSEIGLGAVSVFPFYEVVACTNLATMTKLGSRKRHSGAKLGDGGEDGQWYSDETRMVSDVAYFMQVRDLVLATFNPTTFDKMLVPMREAAGYRVEREPDQAVKTVANKFQLSEAEEKLVLSHFTAAGDRMANMWGLSNAVTRSAQDVKGHDRTMELQKIGGDIITLGRDEWREIGGTRKSTFRGVDPDDTSADV